jgi:hypothetical protein
MVLMFNKKKKYTVPELKKKCKEMKVKNCSKLKKAQLMALLVKDASDSLFDRKKKLEEMKKKVSEHFDPVFAQRFDDWSDEDLKHSILLGSHFYLPETLLEHVRTKQKEGHVVKDPMNGTIIPVEKLKEIFRANKLQYEKVESFRFDTTNMNIKVERKFFKIFSYRAAQPFMQIILKYNPSIYVIKTKNPFFKKPDEILIGNVPMGISISPEASEVKALDASSTSEVIMSKILEMIRNGKLFSHVKDNKMTLNVLKYLPKTIRGMRKWFNTNNGRLDTTSPDSEYFKLLREIE